MECRAEDPLLQATEVVPEYVELGRVVGYQAPGKFVAFLQGVPRDQLAAEEAPSSPESSSPFAGKSPLLVLLMIFGYGFLMNLLPCVLPMIPVNLAILTKMQLPGATAANSKRKTFLNGCVYGAGIATAYGALGLVTLTAGTMFGTWHSTAFFNGIVAAFFVTLALAMLDVFTLDFSRWSIFKGGGIFGLGMASALLAGACIAPILIAVLVYSTQLYAEGRWYGVLLPFALGLGMASPWPFIASGIRMLPRPGKWMVWVKRAFAVILVGFAISYGLKAYAMSRPSDTMQPPAVDAQRLGQWAAIDEALSHGKPVLLDFGASWCPACVDMERVTLRDEMVMQKLEDFTFLKVDCTNPNAPDMRQLLQRFNVPGLPTFVVIAKKAGK